MGFLAVVVVVGILIQTCFIAKLTPCRYCEETGNVIVMRCLACDGSRSLTLWQWAKAAVFGAPRR